MHTRRQFIMRGALATGSLAMAAPAVAGGDSAYAAAVRQTWRHADRVPAGVPELARELVRYATLAPSSHNTQCWKFRISGGALAILPDFGRRCPIVDPDDHHLFVSLGCATENLVLAASAFGRDSQVSFDAGPDPAITVGLVPAKAVRSQLFEAIPVRQSTRAQFDGRPLSVQELELLSAAGRGDGVQVRLLTDQPSVQAVLDIVVEGNTAEISDPVFIRELRSWLRFNAAAAVASGDGLFTRTTGSPELPSWLGGMLFGLFFSAKEENDKYVRQVRSSAGIAIFVSETDDRRHWIEAGRAFQRFALQATALGIRNAPLNQAVEVPAARSHLADFLGLKTGRPDFVARFGRGAEMPCSLRRPVEAVLA